MYLLRVSIEKTHAPATAAKIAEQAKVTKYGTTPGGCGVQGMALELTGRFGPELDAHLRRCAGLARAKSTAHGKDAPRLLQHWQTRLSILLARFWHAAIASAESCPEVAHTVAANRQHRTSAVAHGSTDQATDAGSGLHAVAHTSAHACADSIEAGDAT